jgi:dihydrofolate synthase/folylpolyglutamate synthase
MSSAHDLLAGLERFGIRLGLEHLRGLAGALGSPERAIPAVIVAGTNGKGSVASLLASIATRSGLATGLYTSPHLEFPEERIRLAGSPIPEAELAALLREVLDAATRLGHSSPTYFEAMTLAAFLHFTRRDAGLAVLEVGMGGRLDATNLADARLAVIAPVAFDHQEFLGNTLDAIAREKAGVLRPGAPAVFAPQPGEATQALHAEARRCGAPVTAVDEEVRSLEVQFRGLEGLRLRLETRQQTYDLETALAGRHQAWNVATAVVAAERFPAATLAPLAPSAIVAGVAACRWPGRLERLQARGPAAAVLLDAAHNPAGCEALCAFLDELGRPFTLLFGALADKELGGMLPALAVRSRRIVLTRPVSPRAADPAALAALLPGGREAVLEPAIEPALAAALAGENELVVACGSIFLIGEIRHLLTARAGWIAP